MAEELTLEQQKKAEELNLGDFQFDEQELGSLSAEKEKLREPGIISSATAEDDFVQDKLDLQEIQEGIAQAQQH